MRLRLEGKISGFNNEICFYPFSVFFSLQKLTRAFCFLSFFLTYFSLVFCYIFLISFLSFLFFQFIFLINFFLPILSILLFCPKLFSMFSISIHVFFPFLTFSYLFSFFLFWGNYVVVLLVWFIKVHGVGQQ